MKKYRIIHILSIILILSFVFFLFLPKAALCKDKYTIGFYAEFDPALQAQAKIVWEDVCNVLSDELNIELQFIWYNDIEVLMKALKTNSIDFIYIGELVLFNEFYIKNDYNILFTYSAYGVDKGNICLYSKKGIKDASIESFRSKRMAFYGGNIEYYWIRKEIGQRPESFFSDVISNEAFSTFYSLALGDVDCVISADVFYKYFEATNPGPIKDVDNIYCSEIGYNLPMMVSEGIENDPIVEVLLSRIVNARNDKAFKKFWPIIRILDFKFIEVDENDYKPLFSLIDEAIKKGWDKDYQIFVKGLIK